MSQWIVSSSVLILVIAIMRRLLRGRISLRLQYALWAIVLLRLLVPVSFGGTAISVMNIVEERESADITVESVVLPSAAPQVQTGGEIMLPEQNTELIPPAVGGTTAAQPNAPEENRADFEELLNRAKAAMPKILKGIWLGGMAVFAAVFAASNLRFGRILRKNRERYDCGGSLPVYLTDKAETPCLYGIFRPAVYITKEAAGDERVLSHVFAHEMTHFRHGDHIWSVLRCLCLVLHWYNPLVWLAAGLSRRDAELACDEGAIRLLGEESRADYGRTLIGLTVSRSAVGDMLSCATTMVGSKKGIKERIVLIAKKPQMALYTLAAVILVTALTIGCTFTGAKTDEGFVPERFSINDTLSSVAVQPVYDPELVSEFYDMYLGLEKGAETEGDGRAVCLFLSFHSSETEEFKSVQITSEGLIRELTDEGYVYFRLENGKEIFEKINAQYALMLGDTFEEGGELTEDIAAFLEDNECTNMYPGPAEGAAGLSYAVISVEEGIFARLAQCEWSRAKKADAGEETKWLTFRRFDKSWQLTLYENGVLSYGEKGENEYFIGGEKAAELFAELTYLYESEVREQWLQYAAEPREESIESGVPKAVLDAAYSEADAQLEAYINNYPHWQADDRRVLSAKHVHSYGDIDGEAYELYLVETEYHFNAPWQVLTAGGTYITSEGWLGNSYLAPYYLYHPESGQVVCSIISGDYMPENEDTIEALKHAMTKTGVPAELAGGLTAAAEWIYLDSGAPVVYGVSGDYFGRRMAVIFESFEWTQRSQPLPEFWGESIVVITGEGWSLRIWENAVELSADGGVKLWDTKYLYGDESIYHLVRPEYDNAEFEGRLYGFGFAVEGDNFDAAEYFVNEFYRGVLMGAESGGQYSVTDYRVVDWGVLSVKPDGSGIVGRVEYAVVPENWNSPGIWAGNTADGEGEYEGMAVMSREFVLERQPDGSWACKGLGTGGYASREGYVSVEGGD